jgi:hypothetical protein
MAFILLRRGVECLADLNSTLTSVRLIKKEKKL